PLAPPAFRRCVAPTPPFAPPGGGRPPPLPARERSKKSGAPPPAAAVVCVVPSGNFTPPSVVSIIPATVNFEAASVTPIPTLPPPGASSTYPNPPLTLPTPAAPGWIVTRPPRPLVPVRASPPSPACRTRFAPLPAD